jgi:serine/threonine protein kinase
MPRIWVTDSWYIPVDDFGYVEGPCFEGMLGCVLQLRVGTNDALLAMKIPRLLADTIEENAYICNMTEEEEEAVRKINTTGGSVEGLVAAQFFESNRMIKRRVTIQSDYEDARAQHDHVVFVSFEHDQKPRFCAVNLTEKGWSIFPEKSEANFVRDITKDDWTNFVMGADGEPLEPHQTFSRAVYRSRESEKMADQGEMREALRGQQSRVWYAAIPSMIFQWAGGNLQELITKGGIGDWTFDEHFVLFKQILTGVRFLHHHRMIHGDIRPANVMWISSREPNNFRLGDYGSYGKEWQAVSRQGAPGGLTLIGPAVGQRRQSPFYSPERRAGDEFESADTALVKRIKSDDKTGAYAYVVLLGWRSQIFAGGSVSAEIRALMEGWGKTAFEEEQERLRKEEEKARQQSEEEQSLVAGEGGQAEDNAQRPAQRPLIDPSSEALQRGDRLRLRNYLFQVIASEKTGNNLKLYLCSGRYADVLHGSLVVYRESGFIKDWTTIDLSNYVEFRQWSAASDLYSVGALFLYSLFCCGLQRQLMANHPPEPNNLSAEDPDRLFVEMIEILESVPYFRFFWEELEAFRQRIEELYKLDPQPTPEEVAKTQVVDGQTLWNMALFATNNILQSTPKARVVLDAFDYNLAHFLLFMHFVLACLHRQSHMSEEAWKKVKDREKSGVFLTPFAVDRLEAPEPNGAAAKALARLLVIEQYLDQQFFREFKCKNKEQRDQVLDFDPRSDFQIRIEHDKLKTKIRSSWMIGKPQIPRWIRRRARPAPNTGNA